jgi:hypothetical protein
MDMDLLRFVALATFCNAIFMLPSPQIGDKVGNLGYKAVRKDDVESHKNNSLIRRILATSFHLEVVLVYFVGIAKENPPLFIRAGAKNLF